MKEETCRATQGSGRHVPQRRGKEAQRPGPRSPQQGGPGSAGTRVPSPRCHGSPGVLSLRWRVLPRQGLRGWAELTGANGVRVLLAHEGCASLSAACLSAVTAGHRQCCRPPCHPSWPPRFRVSWDPRYEQWLLAFAGLPGIQVPKGAVRIKCRSTPTQTATPRPCDSAQQQGTETTLRF